MRVGKLYIILWMIWAYAGLSGCSDILLEENGSHTVEEGVPVSVSVKFSTERQKVQTRVEQTPETEYNVTNIYLLAFNARGEKTGGQAFTVGENGTTGTYSNETFKGTINGFNVLSGADQKLYAIANYNSGDFDLTEAKLEGIKTEAELQGLSIKMDGLLLNRLSFVMVGVESNVVIDTDGQISTLSGEDVDIELKRLDAKITFHVEAKIEGATDLKFIPKNFMVMQLPLNSALVNREENIEGASFVSMDENSDEEDKAPVTVFDEVGETEFTFNFYMLENYSAPPAKGVETTQGSKKGKWIDESASNNEDVKNLYALREKEYKEELVKKDPNRPGMTEKNTGEYVYAPGTATYVVINGELSYQRPKEGSSGETEYVNVSARYTIHLGETGTAADADNVDRVNNYTVARNTHYTYNITLTGIDSYDAEVNSDKKEVRPGMEGDVIIAGDQVRSIDSHYYRTRIRFTRTALQNGLSWIIQTPFDQGMKLSSSTENNLKDYKWVLFAVNKEFRVNSSDGNTMVKFPGYEAYDGGAITTKGTQIDANRDEGNNFGGNKSWKDIMTPTNYYSSINLLDDACLRDVNQLINHLTVLAKNDAKWSQVGETDENGVDVVYVTAFVDEYVYVYDPTSKEYIVPDTSIDDSNSLQLWKKVVNGTDRMMHICTAGATYSPDGESSWSNSVLTIRQSPIYSIYNEHSDVTQAWGTESILETRALPIDPDGSYSLDHGENMSLTMNNGRYNTLSIFGSVSSDGKYNSKRLNWTDVLSRNADYIGSGDDPKENELQPEYRDVWHACMTRNRDLNGDNVIDPEEIRWVMASIDELTDIWIGQNSLPTTAHLYQGDGSYAEHVVSSSGSYTSPWIIWAEEGASRGQYNDGNYKDPTTGARDYKYRCIRYLGIPLDDIEDIPDDYVKVTKGYDYNYGTTYTLDVSNLDYSSRRSSTDGGRELPRHYERGNDGNNQPYRAFEVLVDPQGAGDVGRRWNYESAHDSESGNPKGFEEMMNYGSISGLCPRGYRVPNQRELMLMYTSLNNTQYLNGEAINVPWTDNYWSATRFSYNGKGIYQNTERPGFATNGANMILTSTSWSWNNDAWDYTPTADNVAAKVRCVRDVEN